VILKRNIVNLKLNSLILSIILLANHITNLISLYIQIPNLFAILFILLFLLFILLTKLKINYFVMFIILIILVQFLISSLFVKSEMLNSFFYAFILIGIPSMILTQNRYDYDLLLKYVQLISIFSTHYYYIFYVKSFNTYNSGELMGISYSILPILLLSFLFILNYKKYNNYWLFLGILNISSLLILTTKFITRGFFLCVIVFFILYIMLKIKNDFKNLFKFLFLIILVTIIYSYFIHPEIIHTKWYYYIFEIKKENFLNGREFDYDMIFKFKSILEFLFGSGIGSFYQNTGQKYLHNVLGMIFYEQGIFSLIFLLIVILKSIKVIIFSNLHFEYNNYLILIFLFSVSITRLMFSYYFWIDQMFWIYLVFTYICLKSSRLISNKE